MAFVAWWWRWGGGSRAPTLHHWESDSTCWTMLGIEWLICVDMCCVYISVDICIYIYISLFQLGDPTRLIYHDFSLVTVVIPHFSKRRDFKRQAIVPPGFLSHQPVLFIGNRWPMRFRRWQSPSGENQIDDWLGPYLSLQLTCTFVGPEHTQILPVVADMGSRTAWADELDGPARVTTSLLDFQLLDYFNHSINHY